MANYRVHLEWGIWGVEAASLRGDTVVIVDTLSFSTSTVLACKNGAAIYPAPDYSTAKAIADKNDATIAVKRNDVPSKGRYSLSPVTMRQAKANEKIVLPSVNGANCSTSATGCSGIFAAALVNASVTAQKLTSLLKIEGTNVTIIVCGERIEEGGRYAPIRMAIEDYYAAGMILSKIDAVMSVEAQLCRAAYSGLQSEPLTVLWECTSGLELRERGYRDDVRIAAQVDICDYAPLFDNGCYR